MSLLLPFPLQAASRAQITLEDTAYSLLLTWNERAGAWSLGLEDADGQPVLLGRRVVLQLDLLSGYRHLPLVPRGGIFALDVVGSVRKIARGDFQAGRVELRYFTRAELDAL